MTFFHNNHLFKVSDLVISIIMVRVGEWGITPKSTYKGTLGVLRTMLSITTKKDRAIASQGHITLSTLCLS